MATAAQIHKKLRAFCLALPDTEETEKWGKPHFCVQGKIFCGCGEQEGKPVLGFKLDMPHAARIVQRDDYWPSPYVGKHGWVTRDGTTVRAGDWKELQELVMESYRLIAPKRSLAELE